MILRFEDLNVGDRFKTPFFESECIKISDEKTHGRKLSKCPANAINLDTKHRIVVGDRLIVERVDEPEDEESLYPRLMLSIENEKIKELLDERIEFLKARKNETPVERSIRILRENSVFGAYGQFKFREDLGGGK